MDDMKLTAKSEEEIRKRIQTIKNFSDDIHIDFGLEKCAKITFKKGKLVHSQNLVIDINPLAYTDGCQTAGLSRSIFTQPAVRRSEPSMSFLLILAFCQ